MTGKKKINIFGKLQRAPKEKWKKEEFSELEYEPVTVKELLTEMKDISELIIDLAYSAVLFNTEDIAEEVKYLEVRISRISFASFTGFFKGIHFSYLSMPIKNRYYLPTCMFWSNWWAKRFIPRSSLYKALTINNRVMIINAL